MFENQYKADFHRWTSGPRRVPGDIPAAVLAQGSGSCSKHTAQTLKLFTLLLRIFTPLLMSGGSEHASPGMAGTAAWTQRGSNPGIKTNKQKEDSVHRAILHPKGEQNHGNMALCRACEVATACSSWCKPHHNHFSTALLIPIQNSCFPLIPPRWGQHL